MKKNFLKLSLSFVLLLGIALSALFSGCDMPFLEGIGLEECGIGGFNQARKFGADDLEEVKEAYFNLDSYEMRIYGEEEWDREYKVTSECIYVKYKYFLEESEIVIERYIVKNGEKPYALTKYGDDGEWQKADYPEDFDYEIKYVGEFFQSDFRYNKKEKKYELYSGEKKQEEYLKIEGREIIFYAEGKPFYKFYNFGVTTVEIPTI